MPRRNVINRKDWIRIIENNGFRFKRMGKGSHEYYYRSSDKHSMSVAKEPNCMWQRRMIKEHNLVVE